MREDHCVPITACLYHCQPITGTLRADDCMRTDLCEPISASQPATASRSLRASSWPPLRRYRGGGDEALAIQHGSGLSGLIPAGGAGNERRREIERWATNFVFYAFEMKGEHFVNVFEFVRTESGSVIPTPRMRAKNRATSHAEFSLGWLVHPACG